MVDELVLVLPGKHRRLVQPGNVEHQLDERSPTAALAHPARSQRTSDAQSSREGVAQVRYTPHRVVEHLLDDRARLSPAPPARTSDPTPRGPAARHASRTW